jgi:hypothetical protein
MKQKIMVESVCGKDCLLYSRQEAERDREEAGDKIHLSRACPNDLFPPTKPYLLLSSPSQ